jgi:hypothetical protein
VPRELEAPKPISASEAESSSHEVGPPSDDGSQPSTPIKSQVTSLLQDSTSASSPASPGMSPFPDPVTVLDKRFVEASKRYESSKSHLRLKFLDELDMYR